MMLGRLKKIPLKFLDYDLFRQVKDLLKTGNKNYILKTKARNSMIYPCFINLTISVYNGKKYVPLKIQRYYVGHKFGEFVLTRKCAHTKQNVASKVQKKVGSTLYRQFFDNCTYKPNILLNKSFKGEVTPE